jgi:NADH-quinone oxidoreductase subunit N
LNSAYIWIFFPGLVALGLFLLQKRETLVAILGTIVAVVLAGLAAWLPVQEQIFIWRWVVPYSDTFIFFGRRFVLGEVDRPSLIIIYLIAALWFGAAPLARPVRLFVPLGLAMVTLLTAAIAVEPFLFAAVIIEIAVLVSIPFLSPPGKLVGRGVLRYLSFQTIGMPFILISGFMLSGFEISPGDQQFAIIAIAFLAIGFGLLLGVFPFHTWIPMLTQESHPHSTAFVLLLLPGAVSLLGLGFLDSFIWLREAAYTALVLQIVGALMILTGGIWAAVERHLARMMGFALILDIGFSLMALGLASESGSDLYRGLFFAGLLPRGLSLGVWALALSGLLGKVEGLKFENIQGIGRRFPFISIGIVLSIFCLAGVPLLASFPTRLGIIEGLALMAPQFAPWVIIGSLGLLVGGIRTLISIVSGTDEYGWEFNESRMLIIYLLIGIIILIVLGIYPNLFFQLLENLPASFGRVVP